MGACQDRIDNRNRSQIGDGAYRQSESRGGHRQGAKPPSGERLPCRATPAHCPAATDAPVWLVSVICISLRAVRRESFWASLFDRHVRRYRTEWRGLLGGTPTRFVARVGRARSLAVSFS